MANKRVTKAASKKQETEQTTVPAVESATTTTATPKTAQKEQSKKPKEKPVRIEKKYGMHISFSSAKNDLKNGVRRRMSKIAPAAHARILQTFAEEQLFPFLKEQVKERKILVLKKKHLRAAIKSNSTLNRTLVS